MARRVFQCIVYVFCPYATCISYTSTRGNPEICLPSPKKNRRLAWIIQAQCSEKVTYFFFQGPMVVSHFLGIHFCISMHLRGTIGMLRIQRWEDLPPVERTFIHFDTRLGEIRSCWPTTGGSVLMRKNHRRSWISIDFFRTESRILYLFQHAKKLATKLQVASPSLSFSLSLGRVPSRTPTDGRFGKLNSFTSVVKKVMIHQKRKH